MVHGIEFPESISELRYIARTSVQTCLWVHVGNLHVKKTRPHASSDGFATEMGGRKGREQGGARHTKRRKGRGGWGETHTEKWPGL